MKVVRIPIKPTFRPIQITLETEKEACYLWHLLNCGGEVSFRDYCRSKKVEELIKDFSLFNLLNQVFNPMEDEEF